ncbi:MAG: biotin-dependent carboxyltransferase family protein [Opitutaceae bacterium]
MPEVIEILSTGVGLSIQDGGREGWRRFGVPVGGAMDRHSMAVANRLLGNREDAPILEVIYSGAKLRVLKDTWLAIAGANLCASSKPWRAERFSAGQVLEFTAPISGLFAYVAVPGGVVSQRWFGSAAVDARNGLGVVLKSGARVSAALGAPNFSDEGIGARIALPEDRRVFSRFVEMDLYRGPQYDLFPEASRQALVGASWKVSARSDRTGFRLEGPELQVPVSIASEPVLPGSFQIPGNGQPIVTMVDGPTVGGYSKLAVLPESERDRLAQCAPGTQVSFRWID